MKTLRLMGMLAVAVLFVLWSIFCAVLPAALVLWNLGEWQGDVFVVPPGNGGVIIAAVLFGNVTGIAGILLFARIAGKLER